MEIDNNNGSSANTTMVERLAEKFGISANTSRIYGEPVERDGVTVIPVSKAAYGFGGGAGIKAGEEGSGGGGGMSLTPIGYIEMKGGETRFRSIRDPKTAMKIVTVGGVFSYLIARTISKIFSRK